MVSSVCASPVHSGNDWLGLALLNTSLQDAVRHPWHGQPHHVFWFPQGQVGSTACNWHLLGMVLQTLRPQHRVSSSDSFGAVWEVSEVSSPGRLLPMMPRVPTAVHTTVQSDFAQGCEAVVSCPATEASRSHESYSNLSLQCSAVTVGSD